jgi:hypothetical protein
MTACVTPLPLWEGLGEGGSDDRNRVTFENVISSHVDEAVVKVFNFTHDVLTSCN